MTNSNKTLLKALLNIEVEFFKAQKLIETNNLFFTIQFDFKHIYDLFEVIITSFNIYEEDYDTLYNILNELSNNTISATQALENIELLIH